MGALRRCCQDSARCAAEAYAYADDTIRDMPCFLPHVCMALLGAVAAMRRGRVTVFMARRFDGAPAAGSADAIFATRP